MMAGLGASGAGQSALTADSIMARVAARQTQAIALRTEYVYQQRISITTRKPDGKLMRQETAEYEIVPGDSGLERNLRKLDGKYWTRGPAREDQYIEFHDNPAPDRGRDGWFFDQCRNALLNERSCEFVSWGRYDHTRFPLTAEEQNYHRFELVGEEVVSGRKAYRIRFWPRNRHDFHWAGEILIDALEFQPISGYTRFARRIPLPARVLTGTNFQGAGSSVSYQRFDNEVWFPVSFGSEFRMHFLFFFNRIVTISAESFGFRRTRVRSTIRFENTEKQQPR
jgi:hypothetical protein